MNFTVNKVRKVVYVAQNFTAGLTDLTLVVRQPDGTPVTPNPTVTEQGAGVYTVSYTPTQVGVHQELISSATNGDKVFKAVAIEAVDTDDVNTNVSTSATAVETAVAGVKSDLDAGITAIEADITTVGTAVTANGTAIASVKSDVDASTTAIQSSIASVQSTVNSIVAAEGKAGGYFA